ncbi:hypothetical protein CRENPOLYSF1_900037 [Crenothrix polyspora]|uniref:Uncharacterized protein n=2 Tax=Crenothrix polyspora TaxID=360316 RepID=A0A1R4HKW4_9GAMM|nr:hypothetical protein CRENPOLYSF1_900037 [Crenothrix polyspora]
MTRTAQYLIAKTLTTKLKQHETAMTNSARSVEKMNTKPCSLIRDEKLDTQKGIKNSLTVCQVSDLLLGVATLSSNPQPITALMPSALIHIFGDGSKWCSTVTEYQIR